MKHQRSDGTGHWDEADIRRDGEFSALGLAVFLEQDVVEVELLDWLDGAAALLQDPTRLINLEGVLLPLRHGQSLVVDVAGLLVVASLLWLTLILPLVDDNALNILRIDKRLQEPLAVGDGDETLEKRRLAKLLDRLQQTVGSLPPGDQGFSLRLCM